MSKTEYSFHNRRKNNNNIVFQQPQPSQTSGNSNDTTQISPHEFKSTILQQYDLFVSLKSKNERVKYLNDTQELLSKEIVDNVGLLQKSPSKEDSHIISQKLERITSLHKELKDEYTTLLKTELSIIYNNFPEIFDKIVVDGINRETLEHVLTVFDEYQKGKMNSEQAVSHGIDYMNLKYNLPDDFFNKDAIKDFNKNLHKQP